MNLSTLLYFSPQKQAVHVGARGALRLIALENFSESAP
jgi:hypothetical protein